MDRLFFGETLAKIRREKGLTQKELGDKVGLPDVRIRQYETGYRTPKRTTVIKLAQALEISIDELGFSTSIGDKIRDLRAQQGMTQAELAEEVGIHLVTIKKYETKEVEPRFNNLKKIAHALGVEVSYFQDSDAQELSSTPEFDYNLEMTKLREENISLKKEVKELKARLRQINGISSF